MGKVVVLGVGNVLLSDEGFGVRVAEYLLARFNFPENCAVIDGGTMGYELLRFIYGAEKLLLIDAVSGNQPPGTMFQAAGENVKTYYRQKVSMHQLGIQEVLAMLEVSGQVISEVRLIGVQPAVMTMGLALSRAVEPMVEKAAAAVMNLLASWDIHCQESRNSETIAKEGFGHVCRIYG